MNWVCEYILPSIKPIKRFFSCKNSSEDCSERNPSNVVIIFSCSIGENGLLRKAQFARDEYNNAVGKEEHELNELYAYLNGDDLPENTPENPQDVGKPVKLPDAWQTITPNYISLDDGSIVTKSIKLKQF